MAIEVNSSLGSEYTQVIQSVHNRRRIDEQQVQNLQQQKEDKSVAVETVQVVKEPRNQDGDNYQQMYANAKRFISESERNEYGVSAYSKVQNQGAREEMQSMLGISVYA